MTATPPEAQALPAAPGLLHRARVYFEENERALAVAFFVAGFLFDIVTTGRIDSWVTIAQQLAYLLLVTAALIQLFHEQGKPAPDAASLPRLKRWLREYRTPLVHFLLGALLNLYAIYFFKSSSLLVSFGFLGVLVVLLVANESRRFKERFGLPFKFILVGLCWLCCAASVLPILAGRIGTGVFLASMALGALPLAFVAWRQHRRGPEVFLLARRQILLPLGGVLVAFLAAYLFRVIPPVPLSVPFIGVYHGVERTAEGYRLSHERDWWRVWHNGDQNFRARPGDRVYVFFRIFSPSRFADRVQLRWFWKDPARGWTSQDAIPINIVGGREQGFRGYGMKANFQAGAWKVQVETADGREIGRVYFDLELLPDAPGRVFRADLE